MRPTTAITRSTIVCVLAVAACTDGTAPRNATDDTTLPLPDVRSPDLGTLARLIPGFGGLYIDHGIPTVYLTDPAQRPAAERALGGFAAARGLAQSQIRVVPGRQVFGDLDRWFRALSLEAFAIPGVVYTDLDEAANRVAAGVEHASAAASVRGLAARLRIPMEALEVRVTEPIGYAATLRDQVRPVVAGLQINFSNFICSIGFNAISGGQNSFVTASHCTDRQGGTEGTQYFQNLASTPNSFIGTEVDDPRYFRNQDGCPKGRRCRFSDAARAAYDAGVSFTLGGIASTSGPNNGSITITGTLSITSQDTALVGDVVNKIGRTTGWTQGVVSATCVNTGVSGTNIGQLGQTFVNAGVGGGDSGSDVFEIVSGSSVRLLGTLWGGNSSGTMFVYSPITNIQQELGSLTTN